uniref:Methyltransferase domain-containing protein n=1 Tax=Candidatus Methanomethylicus mesodigestus TaxID=1867258 RepID=A0A7C3FD14_9CREN
MSMPVHDFVIDPFVLRIIPKSAKGNIVDVGCGYGLFGHMIRFERGYEGALIGVDRSPLHLSKIRRYGSGIYDALILADATRIPLGDGSSEIAIAQEVIEHLSNEDGERLLDELERISSRLIIVTTPRGRLPQDCEGSLEIHRSGWSEKEFISRGYEVIYAGSVQMSLRGSSAFFSIFKVLNALMGLMPDFIKRKLPKYELVAFKVKG